MSQNLVISFDPSGAVEAMHLDTFDLGFLGNKQVSRASEIKFNETTQKWDILVPLEGQESQPVETWQAVVDGAKGFSGYEEARQVEVAWFNAARLEGVHPLSSRGRVLLLDARYTPR